MTQSLSPLCSARPAHILCQTLRIIEEDDILHHLHPCCSKGHESDGEGPVESIQSLFFDGDGVDQPIQNDEDETGDMEPVLVPESALIVGEGFENVTLENSHKDNEMVPFETSINEAVSPSKGNLNDGCGPLQNSDLRIEEGEMASRGWELVPWSSKGTFRVGTYRPHLDVTAEKFEAHYDYEDISQFVSSPSFPPGFEKYIPEDLKDKGLKKRREKEKKRLSLVGKRRLERFSRIIISTLVPQILVENGS